MSATQHNHWHLFDQLQHEINRAHGYKTTAEDSNLTASSDWTPAVDIKEEMDKFILVADIPGIDPEQIDIHMENGILTIKGERESELKNEQKEYHRIERKHGTFYRRFTLPEGVNAEAIEATSKHGVLTLSIPKQEAVKPRKITVN